MCRTVLYEELHSRGTSNWGYVIEGYPKSPDQLVDLEHSVLLIFKNYFSKKSNISFQYSLLVLKFNILYTKK